MQNSPAPFGRASASWFDCKLYQTMRNTDCNSPEGPSKCDSRFGNIAGGDRYPALLTKLDQGQKRSPSRSIPFGSDGKHHPSRQRLVKDFLYFVLVGIHKLTPPCSGDIQHEVRVFAYDPTRLYPVRSLGRRVDRSSCQPCQLPSYRNESIPTCATYRQGGETKYHAVLG